MKRKTVILVIGLAYLVLIGWTTSVGADGGPVLLQPHGQTPLSGGAVAVLLAFVAFWIAALTALIIAEPPESQNHE